MKVIRSTRSGTRLGISGETLRTWVRKDTARQHGAEGRRVDAGEASADELARLRAENAHSFQR